MSDWEPDSASFKHNYGVLKATAEWLSKPEEPDIDPLVPLVERQIRPYRFCRDRPERVKETLGQYLPDDGPKTGEGRPELGVDGHLARDGYRGQDGMATGTDRDPDRLSPAGPAPRDPGHGAFSGERRPPTWRSAGREPIRSIGSAVGDQARVEMAPGLVDASSASETWPTACI
jgi:hypothetical protein